MSSITPKPGMTVEISMQGIEKSRLDAIEAAESLRKANEAKRTEAETARANAEALRRQTFEANEANRHTAFESAESARESEWTEIKHGMEISVGTAVADTEDAAKNANSAATAANSAAESANAALQKSVRYDEAQTLSDAQKAQARENIESASEAYVNELKSDVVAITPDDTVVDGKPWTSKKTVDSLCMPLEESGNPVQVYPVENYPLGVKVSLEPVQEGSGDPSPDNIRPIVGWDSVKVNRCGKNLLDLSNAYAVGYNIAGPCNFLQPNTTYTFAVKKSHGIGFGFFLTDSMIPGGATIEKNLTNGYIAEGSVKSFTTPADISMYSYIILAGSKYGIIDYYPDVEFQLELGSAATAYEPYQGDAYTAELPETIYGGELDWNTGVLTVDRRITIADGTVNKFTPDHMGTFWNTPFKSAPGTIDVMGVQNSHFKKDKFGLNGYNDFLFTTPEYMNGLFDTADNLNAYLVEQNVSGTPVTFVYKLKTPYTVQLTPQQIAALSGTNTLYTDAGTLTVTGREDPQHTITELKNAIISLGGNI